MGPAAKVTSLLCFQDLLSKQQTPVFSPAAGTFLLMTRPTWPLRAAPCIKSMTYLCGFPTTGIPSTNSSSSPGRKRPSRSAGLFSIIAPIKICCYRWIVKKEEAGSSGFRCWLSVTCSVKVLIILIM